MATTPHSTAIEKAVTEERDRENQRPCRGFVAGRLRSGGMDGFA